MSLTAMRYPHTPTRMAITKHHHQMLARLQNWITHTLLIGMQVAPSLLKTAWQFLKKLNMLITIKSSNCTFRPLFQRNEDLFTKKQPLHKCLLKLYNSPKPKQPRYSSTCKWLNKLPHTYIMGYTTQQ